jgi:hypothetical protein
MQKMLPINGYDFLANSIKLISAGDIKRIGDTFKFKSVNNLKDEDINILLKNIYEIVSHYNGRFMNFVICSNFAECLIRVSLPLDPPNIRRGLHLYQNFR